MTAPTELRPATGDSPINTTLVMARYDQAVSDRHEALQDIIDIRYDLARLERGLTDLEAEIMVNGGTTTHPINGKNKEERDAQLRVAIANDATYQAALQKVSEAKRLIARADLMAETANNEMRGARLRIELQTSWNHRLAGVEAASVKGR